MKNVIFSYFRNKKRFVPFLLIIIISLLSIVTLLYILFCFNYYFEENIKNKIVNRTFVIVENELKTNNDIENELKNNCNVSEYFRLPETASVELPNNKMGTLFYLPIEEINIIYGTTPTKKEDVIISEKLAKKISENNIKNIIGENLRLNKYDINLRIVGIYSNKSLLDENYIYVSNDLTEIISDTNNFYIVIIKNYKSANNFFDGLYKQKYDISLYNEQGKSEIKIYENILKIIKIMIVISIMFLFGLNILIINNIIFDEKEDIAILKTLGFQNEKIAFIILIRLYFFFIIAIVVTISTFVFAYLIFKIFSYYINFEKNIIFNTFIIYNAHKIIVPIIFIIFMSIIIPLISTFKIYKKIKTINPIYLFKVT